MKKEKEEGVGGAMYHTRHTEIESYQIEPEDADNEGKYIWLNIAYSYDVNNYESPDMDNPEFERAVLSDGQGVEVSITEEEAKEILDGYYGIGQY